MANGHLYATPLGVPLSGQPNWQWLVVVFHPQHSQTYQALVACTLV
jgi:hypothetical protein